MTKQFPEKYMPMFGKMLDEARSWGAEDDGPSEEAVRVQTALALVGIVVTADEAYGLCRVYWETEGAMLDLPEELNEVVNLYECLCQKHIDGGTCFLQL